MMRIQRFSLEFSSPNAIVLHFVCECLFGRVVSGELMLIRIVMRVVLRALGNWRNLFCDLEMIESVKGWNFEDSKFQSTKLEMFKLKILKLHNFKVSNA